MFQRLTQLVARDRREARFVTILLIVIIAAGDVMIGPEVSLDLLYLLPILVTAVFQNRWTLVGDSLLCAAIAETINPQRWTGVWPLRVAEPIWLKPEASLPSAFRLGFARIVTPGFTSASVSGW